MAHHLHVLCRTSCAEVDTNHFKGNCPESCLVEYGLFPDILERANGELAAELKEVRERTAWAPLLPRARLTPHHRHYFAVEPQAASHIRLKIYPDGGVSRLRVFERQGTVDLHASAD